MRFLTPGNALKGGMGTCRPQDQGRSQSHNPGWAKVRLYSFFLEFRSSFPTFPQKFLIISLTLAVRVGDSPTRKGPCYVTAQDTLFFHPGPLKYNVVYTLNKYFFLEPKNTLNADFTHFSHKFHPLNELCNQIKPRGF